MMYQTRLWMFEAFLLVFGLVSCLFARRVSEYWPEFVNTFWPANVNEFLLTGLRILLQAPRFFLFKMRDLLHAAEARLGIAMESFFSWMHLLILLPQRLLPAGALSSPVFPARWRASLDARPGRAVVFAACLALLPVCMAAFAGRAPLPDIHDEYCNLLSADTFSLGRLANPTHLHWEHFETFHVVQQPAYASKFPPAQGMFLALGKVLAGEPILGVWISFVLMAAALCWALLAFFPPSWALFGTALCVIQTGILGQSHRTGIFGYWTQGYFGGAAGALGGALLFGSVARLREKPSVPLSLVLGLGLAILANSRPYEGLLASIPVAVLLLSWLLKDNRFPRKVKAFHVVLPLLAVLTLTASWMTYYNWRVTGNAFKLPFQHHDEIYAVIRNFGWQPSRPLPAYRHPFIKQFHEQWDDNEYKGDSALNIARKRVRKWVAYYWNFPMFIAVVCLGAVLNSFWMRFFSLEILVALLGVIATSRRELPHHTAPTLTAVYILAVAGFQVLYRWKWRTVPLGKIIVASIFSTYIALACVIVPMGKWLYDPTKKHNPEFRAGIISLLDRADGQDLIVVRYKTDIHGDETLFNWVYNGADIDRSPVAWAMDMGAQNNRNLLDYFKSRRIWLLNANTEIPYLLPYGSEGAFRTTLSISNQDSVVKK